MLKYATFSFMYLFSKHIITIFAKAIKLRRLQITE